MCAARRSRQAGKEGGGGCSAPGHAPRVRWWRGGIGAPLVASQRLRRRAPFNESRARLDASQVVKRRRGLCFRCQESVKRLGTPRNGTDVLQTLRRRDELHNVWRGKGRSAEGAPLISIVALRDNEAL